MVGLVIVSHSRELAENVLKLARQVAGDQVPMALAGGAGENHLEYGTDAMDILEGIQSIHSPDGTLLLMDLGSAILSAEMALEFLSEEQRKKIRLCPAALAEGAIAAAVQASLGAGLNEVYQAAINALQPKTEHLQTPSAIPQTSSEQHPVENGNCVTVRLIIKNPHGLHARPAARFVQTTARFDAQIGVTNLRNPQRKARADSLNALTALGVLQGDEIEITAQGKHARQAVEALKELVETEFGPSLQETRAEKEELLTTLRQTSPGIWQAIPIAGGIAMGKALFLQREVNPHASRKESSSPEDEWQSLQNAIQKTKESLEERYQLLRRQLGDAKSAIFQAHLLMLQDPEILENARSHIFTENQSAAQAWNSAIEKAVNALLQVPDPYLRQRYADLRDVGGQVLRNLLGEEPAISKLAGKGILLVDEINPSEVAQLDRRKVLGVVTSRGAPTSHSAILLRGLGIPSVSGIDPLVCDIQPSDTLWLDGDTGMVWINPSTDIRHELLARRATWLLQRKTLESLKTKAAITLDGFKVEMAANTGSVAEAQAAFENGAEVIGVLRTEFLFLNRQTAPSESEQMDALSQIAKAMHHKPVIVRSLDIGGDKRVAYLPQLTESNPYLGVRGLRLSLRHPEIFLPQLRAILRVAADFPLKLLLPMVATAEEIESAKMWLERAHLKLTQEKVAHRFPIEMGIMIEVPSAALISPKLAPLVDFFSIGTNDLTQYTLAAERGYAELASYHDALHPAILQEIDSVVKSAHAYGKWAGVCGEIASDPIAAPIFVGLEVDELSMTPAEIPRVKAVIRNIRQAEAAELARIALRCTSAAEVRQAARDFLIAKTGDGIKSILPLLKESSSSLSR